MNRENITFTTPSGQNTLVLNSYITGREKRAISAVYLKEVGDLTQEEVKAKGHRGAIIEAVQDLTIRSVVVSVNGKKDGDDLGNGIKFDVVNYLLDLRSSEYDAVSKKINEIVKDADASESGEKKTK